MARAGGNYSVLPFDRWTSATGGLVDEVNRQDTVFFTALVDAASVDRLRKGSQAGGAKPSYTSIVIKAISLALKEHPKMNRLSLSGFFKYRPVQLDRVDAVVAVERVRNGEDAVYAGVIRDTDAKSPSEITCGLARLSSEEEGDDPRLKLFMRLVRWAPGFLCRFLVGLPRFFPRLWVKERGGSFALTTVGKYGVDSICAKWPWPLTFTFGEVKQRPMVVGGAVVARQSFYLSMGFNRRLCNGAPAARFFNRVCEILEEAEAEMGEKKPVAPAVNRISERLCPKRFGIEAAIVRDAADNAPGEAFRRAGTSFPK